MLYPKRAKVKLQIQHIHSAYLYIYKDEPNISLIEIIVNNGVHSLFLLKRIMNKQYSANIDFIKFGFRENVSITKLH